MVRVQVTLCRRNAAVAGDLLEDVRLDAAICHPGKAGVAKAVPCEVLVPECSDDFIPMSSPTQAGRCNGPAARSSEKSRIGLASNNFQATKYSFSDLGNQRDHSDSSSFGALINQAAAARLGGSFYKLTRRRRRLAADSFP